MEQTEWRDGMADAINSKQEMSRFKRNLLNDSEAVMSSKNKDSFNKEKILIHVSWNKGTAILQQQQMLK